MHARKELKTRDELIPDDGATVERLDRGNRPKCLPVLLPTLLITPSMDRGKDLVGKLLACPNLKLTQVSADQVEGSHFEAIRLLVLLLPDDPGDAVAMIDEFASRCEYFLVVGADTSTPMLREAMHAGARDFIPLHAPQEDLNGALFRVADAIAMATKLAPCVAVLNSKGGCGASFLSGALADLLARRDENSQVALVDGDHLQAGQSHLLNVNPEYFFHHALSQAEDLDYTALSGMMTQMKNLHLLPTEPFSQTDTLQSDYHQLPQLMFKLRTHYQNVVVDLSRGPEPWTNPILMEAPIILLVLQDNLASLRSAVATVRHLTFELGIDKSRIHLVLNRYNPGKGGVSLDDVKKTSGIGSIFTVKNDFQRVNACLEEGKRLSDVAGRDAVTSDIQNLSDALFPHGASKDRKGFWAKLWR